MRALLPIACVFLCGCDFSSPDNPFSRQITDKSGTNQLALVYVPIGPVDGPNTMYLDFHSITWRTKVGTNWSDRVVITKADFETSNLRRRWITDIYSLDPSTGNAVIKVAEGQPPQTNGNTASTAIVYSWREWNMTSNSEVRVLRVCKEPFEPYRGRRIKIKLFK